jgi:hypothetical protein
LGTDTEQGVDEDQRAIAALPIRHCGQIFGVAELVPFFAGERRAGIDRVRQAG